MPGQRASSCRMTAKAQSRYILLAAEMMVLRSSSFFLPGVFGKVPDGVAQAEDVGQTVLQLVAEIVVSLCGGEVLPLHFEQGVDVFHREDGFGDDDVDQAGQLLAGVFFS